MGRSLVHLKQNGESKYMESHEKPKLRFGINHRGGSRPGLAKQKDLISGEKPVTQRPDKKKREKQNKR